MDLCSDSGARRKRLKEGQRRKTDGFYRNSSHKSFGPGWRCCRSAGRYCQHLSKAYSEGRPTQGHYTAGPFLARSGVGRELRKSYRGACQLDPGSFCLLEPERIFQLIRKRLYTRTAASKDRLWRARGFEFAKASVLRTSSCGTIYGLKKEVLSKTALWRMG